MCCFQYKQICELKRNQTVKSTDKDFESGAVYRKATSKFTKTWKKHRRENTEAQ